MDTKACSQCSVRKPLGDFTKRKASKDGHHSSCKICTRKRTKEHYLKNKGYYIKKARRNNLKYKKAILELLMYYAKDGCSICDENDFSCMQFDHKNPKEKEFCIAHGLSSGYSIGRMRKEAEKCTVLCANCHSKKTAKQLGWYKAILQN